MFNTKIKIEKMCLLAYRWKKPFFEGAGDGGPNDVN
jgi:hypothetical protein